jgi:hypothetical protein
MTDRLARAWLAAIGEQTVPPFVVELVLINGSRYFLHSVPVVDEESGSAALRIWDFRAFSEEDIETLKNRLNELGTRGGQLPRAEELHPKLDWAILRINLDLIAYCIEWHDRIWPEEKRPPVGFRPSKEARQK